MYGVAYTIAAGPVPDAGDEVFRGASGMKVYRRDAFPRAWAVHELVRVKDADEGNVLLGRDPESLHRKAHMVASPPPVQTCAAPDTVQLIEHAPDRLAIRAEMACDGMVVLSDTFYPGWRARVDHRPAADLRSQWRDARRRSPARHARRSRCAIAPSACIWARR